MICPHTSYPLAILSHQPIPTSYPIKLSCHRGPSETEQPDEHEDRAGPAGQSLLHDGGAELVEGAELQTPEATQLHGGVLIVLSSPLSLSCAKGEHEDTGSFWFDGLHEDGWFRFQ